MTNDLKFFDSNYIHCHIDKPWQVVHKYMGTEIEAIYQNIFYGKYMCSKPSKLN